LRKRVRQNFGLGLEYVAITVFVAGEAEGELLVTAAAKLKVLADADLLEFKGRGHSEMGVELVRFNHRSGPRARKEWSPAGWGGTARTKFRFLFISRIVAQGVGHPLGVAEKMIVEVRKPPS
jgi:hypothetical protein